MNLARKGVFLAVAGLVFAVVNGLIFQREQVLGSGKRVLLRLAPVDPRSLMQGDYMVLRYALERAVRNRGLTQNRSSGHLVIKLDPDGVASFVRVHGDEPLADDELLLRYRYRGSLRLGAESFFFQEGHAKIYVRARYGELRVNPSGDSVLVGLCGEDFKTLGPGPD